MAKGLNQNINLSFTADPSGAVNAIKKLKQELGSLSTGSTLKKSGIAQITPEIQEGIRAAGELKAKLESATNVNTGKLDLSKLSESINKNGMSLQKYAQQLNALGPEGRQAFSNLTKSIMQAEAPLVRCNAKLKELGNSLANTARWQISSSILHGFMGAVSGAYRYAQDLNKSLNDIRIVTGANIDTMEKFAVSANKAARSLSTSTNEYAKASLIFFQQGDTEAEAMQKANVVTKMANVTRQSSEVVSNQLTAIWNNFNKAGDQSYEHYADVLTKLGAATATSTDEIANGLEKFAGIADTIGLSYDYAASALATITATSRESEEVVGTALKTIFARMEGLKLGETLEDGTTLNQYSKALKTAGVSLFDSNNELKTMDTLLSDVATQWKTLSKDNQIALAQGVAGVRQYNQFITLMDNWDFMEENLETAKNATGELQKQSEVYGESWEAASKRVKAAAESLYTKLINDDFFIDFLDGLESVIDGVGGVVDAFGGLKGILFTVGAFATRIFKKEIAESLRNMAYNVKSFLNIGNKQKEMSVKSEALDAMKYLRADEVGEEGKAENRALDRQELMQKRLLAVSKQISAEELKSLQQQMDTVRVMDERAVAAARIADATKEEAEELASLTRAYAKLEARQKAMQELGNKKDAKKSEAQTAKENEYFDKGLIASIGNASTDNNQENLFLKQQYEQARKAVVTKQKLTHVGQLDMNNPETVSQIRDAFMEGIRGAAEDGVEEAKQIVAKIGEVGTEAARNIDAEIQERVKQAANNVDKMQEKSDAAAGTVVRARDLNRTAMQLEGTIKNPDVSINTLSKASEILSRKLAAARKEAQSLQDALGEDADEELKQAIKTLEQLQQELEEAGTDAKALDEVRKKLSEPLGVTDILVSEGNQAGVNATADYFGESGPNTRQEEFFEASMAKKTAEKNKDNASADVDSFAEDLDKSFDNAGQKTADWADGITKATSIVMGLGSAITSVQGMVDVFMNPDASNWDKFSAVMSVLIGILPVLATMFTTTGTAGTAAGVGITAAMGPVGWIIMAIVAAVAALTAAFIALSNAYHEDAINAKKAAENAEKLAEASQKAKEQLQGIKDSFDAYDTAVEKLKNCVRGTEEWNEALKEVNDIVIQLLKDYPQLLGQKDLFSRNEFGMLEISEEKRNEIMETAERSVSTADAAALMASATAAEANAQAKKTETKRSIEGFSYFGTNFDGSRLVEHKDELSGLSPDVFRSKLMELYSQEDFAKATGLIGDDYTAQLDLAYKEMIAHFSQYQDKIDELANATESAATKMNNASQLIVNSQLGEKYGATETLVASQGYETVYSNIKNEILTLGKADYQSEGKTENSNAVWARFQEATGTTYQLADNAVQGTEAERKYAYIDEHGDEKTYTIEYIAEQIAAYEALGKTEENAAAAQKLLQGMSEKGTGLAEAAGKGGESSMTEHISTFTQAELDTLKNSITKDESGNVVLSDAFYSALEVSEQQFQELAKLTGISVTELANTVAKAQENVSKTLSKEEQAYLTNIGINTSGMEVGEQQEFVNNANAFKSKSKEAGIAEDQIDKIISDNKDMDPTQLNEFMTELNGISLNAEGAKDQIADLSEKYNIQGGSIDTLMSSVEGLDQVYFTNTKNTMDQTAKLKEVVGDGLKAGDILDEDDIKTLQGAGVDIDTYFSQMSDGTYSLTGKAEDFNNVVKNISLQQLKDQLNDFNVNAFQQALDKNHQNRDGLVATDLRNSSVTHVTDGRLTSTDAIDLGSARLDYIKSFDAVEFDFTDEQKALLNKESHALTTDDYAMLGEMMDIVNAKAVEVETQLLSTATSVGELGDIAMDIGQYSLTSYSNVLIGLASQYDNCNNEIVELQSAMMSGDEELVKAKIEALELAATIGELSSKYDLNAEDVETHAKLIQESAEGYELTAKQAANLAVANRRMNRGVQTLHENWEDWGKVLKTSDRNSMDYADTLNDVHEALADLTGAVDASVIPMNFLDASTESGAEHLEWMSEAANGSTKAINLLGSALALAQVETMEMDASMAEAYAEVFEFDPVEAENRFMQAKDTVVSAMQEIHDAINSGLSAEDIQARIDKMGGDWIQGLNEMAIATNMSVEDMNGMLNQLGVQAEVNVRSIEQDMEVPTYTEIVEPTEDIGDITGDEKNDGVRGYKRYTVPGPPKKVKGWVQVAEISTAEGEKKPTKITYTGTGGGKASGGVAPSSTKKSGSSSKPKKTSDARKDKSETVERYKEINDQLDDSSKALDKASKAADRLYGADRLKAMDKVNKALEKEIKNLKIKKKEAEEYLAIDKKALEEAATDMNLGINFEYDDKGNIINYEEQMSKVHDAREAMLDSFGSTIDEKEQEKLDSFDEKVSNLTDKQQQYDDTREEKEDIEKQIDDSYEQWQDNNYEKLKYKLELKVELNDQDLQMIEFELSQIEDDIFKQAEAAAIMAGDSTSQTGKSKYDIYKQTADDLKAQKDTLDEAFAKKEISQADYISGLKEIYGDTIENMQALQELDKTMQEYYGNTLNMAAEEIAKYTESMEHQTSVLDHYSSLLEIMGKSNDYEAMGTVLEAKAKTLEDQVAVSKSAMEMYQAQATNRYQKWKDAEARGDKAAAEILKKEYEAALKAAETAEDEFLSKSEEWAESLKAVLENSLKDAAKDLEKALTGGTSFDALTTKMERASSLQEEYLTTTNKIYETNKMINTAQQAIDKTTNTVAKQRLANFQKETAQLQNKKKLSQYELSLQQAKYDLLLAEIALEEAQNAKSTVRLQRDSEGNFGYVYTADQSQVADAQQKMLDAENALYNKGLEGANDYAQKYQQTMQEMYDTLTEIQNKYLNGEYDSYQEYQDAMTEAQNYYYQKLEDYSELYKVAISSDNKVIQDAWSTNFKEMVFSTGQWKTDVANYVGQVSTAFQTWSTELGKLPIKTDLDTLKEKTEAIKDESKNLRLELIGEDGSGGVVKALGDELDAVGKVTEAYGLNRDALLLLIDDLKEYAGLIDTTIEEQSKVATEETKEEPKKEEKKTSSSSSSNKTSTKNSGSGSGGGNVGDNNKPTDVLVEPSPPDPPSLKVHKYSTDTGRGGASTSTKASAISYILSRPIGPLPMYEVFQAGKSIGYVTQADYDAYKNYKAHYKIYTDKYETYKKQIASLDTGGYTGSWGTEGKLAMLHQKELILNADDTANFLTSLEVLREIMNVIDLHSAHAQLSNALSSPIYRDYTEPQILEQQVHIEATFPGVQDRNEIEEAFNNLLNRATQYVSRR